jgi:hypothetical protein
MTDDNEAGGLSGKTVNFLFGTVLAGLVATGFIYKSWREQTRLDFAEERLAVSSVCAVRGRALATCVVASARMPPR